MKTFVKAKQDYDDKLHRGDMYEVIAIIETDKVFSGKAIVIENGEDLECYDSDTFFE